MISKYLPFYKRLIKLAVPLVLTQVGQTIVQLVDNAMVGRVGTVELAAAAFANNVFIIAMLAGMGIFMGVTPLISHAVGAGDKKTASSVIRNSLILSLFLVIGLSFFTWILSYFMHLMGQPEVVWRLAIPYFRVLTISLLPFLIFMLFKQIGEGLNNTVLAMIATLLSNVLNIVLNYILIFGKMGFPEYGLLGAGYATLIARVSMPILIIAGLLISKRTRPYFQLIPLVKTSMKEIWNILKIGFPIAGQLVIEVFAFAFCGIMMGWLGDVPLAAHQIAMSIASATFMIANGVAMATTIRVSYQLGVNAFSEMEKVVMASVHLVLVYMMCCGIALMVFRYKLPLLFTSDVAVIKQASVLIMVASVFQLFDGLQVVCLGILRGFADVKVPMFIAGVSYLLVGVSVSYLCTFVWNVGPQGIWYGFVAGLAIAGGLLSLRIRKNINRVEA